MKGGTVMMKVALKQNVYKIQANIVVLKKLPYKKVENKISSIPSKHE